MLFGEYDANLSDVEVANQWHTGADILSLRSPDFLLMAPPAWQLRLSG